MLLGILFLAELPYVGLRAIANDWRAPVNGARIEGSIFGELPTLRLQHLLYSGHFAPTQLALIASLAESWNGRGGPMRVLARAVNQGVGISIPPDHAGVFETTLLHSLWPDRVEIDRLQPVDLWPDPDNGGDPFGPQRHDANHPLWGIFGSDPRKFDPANSAALLTELVTWLIAEVRDAEPPKPAASLHGEAAKVARSAAL